MKFQNFRIIIEHDGSVLYFNFSLILSQSNVFARHCWQLDNNDLAGSLQVWKDCFKQLKSFEEMAENDEEREEVEGEDSEGGQGMSQQTIYNKEKVILFLC